MNYYVGNPKPKRRTKREKARDGRGVGPYPMGSDNYPQIARGVCTDPYRGPNHLPKRTKLKGWQKAARK